MTLVGNPGYAVAMAAIGSILYMLKKTQDVYSLYTVDLSDGSTTLVHSLETGPWTGLGVARS